MLKAVGIISEYNPFHNGHLYQLIQAKKITNADLTVVVMSGNWVQRGEPAIFDKWSRTRMAIKSGVDLVVELPFQCAVQPADLFAKYAVNILGHLKCDYLSFGCENYHINFKELGNFKIQDSIKNNLKSSMPYASAIREYVFEKTGQSISSPNDILGMNYSVANKSLEHPMQIFPVKRLGAEHDDLKLNIHKNISSASAIRSSIFHKKKNFNDYLPSYYNDFNFDDFINWDDLFPYLKYQIITSSLSDLKQVYQVNEGLEFKLKKEITSSNTFEEFMSKIKSKRYTYARLRRLCCYILVNYKDDAIFDYVRILGFNQTGRTYLKQIKKSVDVPIISRANKNNLNDELKYEYKAGFMISLITHENEDLYRFPLIYK